MADVFDRLKKKARPSVPSRDLSIFNDTTTETQNDSKTVVSHSVFDEADSNEENKGCPQTEPEVVRRTIRIDLEIDSKLDSFCNAHKITRETFLEAAFLIGAENEQIMQEILSSAKKRYFQRKQIGEQRKFQTMAKRINND